MNVLARWLRRAVIWAGPTLVLFVAVLCGFSYWVIRSPAGTHWVLTTAVSQLGGQIQGISGSLWNGVGIRSLTLDMPDFKLRLAGARVRVAWSDLIEHRLHVRELSAESLDLDLRTPPHPAPDTGPFSMPVVPLAVVLDRLAVGRFSLSQDGKPVPVEAGGLDAAASLVDGKVHLGLKQVEVASGGVRMQARGDVNLQDLRSPWPLDGHLVLALDGQGKDSPLCLRRYVPDLPADKTTSAAPGACSVQVDVTARGTADQLEVAAVGHGQSLGLDARATLTPMGAFPLRSAAITLGLADGSSLDGSFDWVSTVVDGVAHDHVTGTLQTRKLDVGALAGPSVPPAVLTVSADFDAQLLDHGTPRSVTMDVEFAKGSSWNHQALSGHLKAKISPNQVAGQAPAVLPASQPAAGGGSPATRAVPPWQSLKIDTLDTDLQLGADHVKAKGALGEPKSRLDLDVRAPNLSAFWPDLPGGLTLKGQVGGDAASHQADLVATYVPPAAGNASASRGKAGTGKTGTKEKARPGKARPASAEPVHLELRLAGRWGAMAGGAQALDGWQATLSRLTVDSGDLGVRLQAPVKVALVPQATGSDPQWQVGKAAVEVLLPFKQSFVLRSESARGGPGWWDTRGGIARLVVSHRLAEALRARFAPVQPKYDNGSVHVQGTGSTPDRDLVLAVDWNLAFRGALQGQVKLRRMAGDLDVPGNPGFTLGLRALELDVTARPRGAAASQLSASLDVVTEKKGRISAQGSAVLHTAGNAAWTLDQSVPQTVKVKADIADLSWVNTFLDDQTELGGSLHADVSATSGGARGTWRTSGTLQGKNIKFLRIDDGVRLFDGTLAAHLDGGRLVLDSLRFPATLRVKPKEWRTAEWISTSPDAKNGSLTITGEWDLFASSGTVSAKLYRYPILQRSDRYAMLTGAVKVDARLPSISVTGDVKADAGWFNLDVLGSVPTVDSDVVVIRPGQQQTAQVPADISLDLKVDLGPRFYLTGYGVNSGLVGSLHILMSGNKLTGVGELRTRGGSIDVYGQHLQLRRGTVTFQGNIANPVLSIEALRTGLAVQAGVRVSGTARKPKIDLVSYPDVSETEKLSWLLLGRAPDEGGGDVALLFSVGASIVGGGEPFYRKLGLDELSIRTGELGSTGSILPPESVVSSANTNPSEAEQQFAQVGKHLADGVTLSLEQALASTGTVGRLSYRLSRRLRAELSAGTVSGVALIYHVFFDN